MDWSISNATAADAAAIASLFAQSWTSPFSRLQFGLVNPPTLATAMASRIAEQIDSPGSKFIVARNFKTSEVAAVAQWAVHLEDTSADTLETEQERNERQTFEDELFHSNLPKGSNHALIMKFTLGTRELRQHTLQGRKHFLLENLATHPKYRGMGLASRLIEWVFPLADKQNALVYLETASDNPAMRLYKKLGFEEQDHHTIEDLSEFVDKAVLEASGSESSHTHVAFIRRPNPSPEPETVLVTK